MVKRVVSGLFAALWAYWAYAGFDFTQHAARRRVPGYPSAGQWHFYVSFSGTMLLFGVVVALLPKRLPTALYATLLVLEIVPAIPFLLVYGGGV